MRFDEAYANAAYIPEGERFPDQWADAALDFRTIEQACGRALLNQPYGADQAFDLFMPSPRPKGVMVFVHGGFWRAFGRKDWSHFATGVMASDWACAVPSYPLAPVASLPEITKSVRHAIEAIAAKVPGPVSLAGHSAGGHLVARMLMGDVGLADSVAARLRVVVPISPVCDLRDLLETSMTEDLKLTQAVVKAESPTLGQKALNVPVSVFVGQAERPKFLEQADEFAKAWRADHNLRPGRHHFDVIDDLLDPRSDMVLRLTGGLP